MTAPYFLMDEYKEASEAAKKKKSINKYILSVSVVLIMTVLSLLFSLYSAGEGDMAAGGTLIWNALTGCNPWWLACIAILVILSYFLDGLIIQVFCRLYTRKYYFHQGVSNSMIGAFYNSVTPGSSGGQVMQVYTMKKQGIEVSNAASIMVMWFIIYQVALIVFDLVAISFEWNTIFSITSFTVPGVNIGGWNGEITMVPLLAIGFGLNLSIVAMLFLMSYSHKVHNFIMHYGIGFLAKIRVVKNPDKSRENLRVQVENFKIELKRLQANVPVTILIFVLFFAILTIRFSIPYYAGLALNAYGVEEGFNVSRLFDACFKSAFQQMVSGIFPLPGSAGISELTFAAMFSDFFVETQSMGPTGLYIVRSASANMAAAQILWRTATFHLVVIVSGFFAAFYHSRPHEDYRYANRQTYVDLQLATFDERKKSADTLYETKQLSRKAIQNKMKDFSGWGQETGDEAGGGTLLKKHQSKKKGDEKSDDDWDSIDIR